MAKRKKKKRTSDPMIQRFMDTIANARRETELARMDTQSQYDKGTGDTTYVHGQVGGYINNMNSKIRSDYDANASRISAANAALQSQMGTTTDQNAGAATNEMARLGVESAGLGTMRDDSNFARLQAQQGGANSLLNNDMSKTNSQAVGDLLGGMNQGQYQSTMGRLANTRNDSLADLSNAFHTQKMKTLQDMNIYRMEKRARERQRRAAADAAARYARRSYGGSSSGGGRNQPAKEVYNHVNPAPRAKNILAEVLSVWQPGLVNRN